MNKKICVFTCITGDYDELHEIKYPEKNINYYCFTNNKNLKSKTWKIIQLNDHTDNWRLARKIKILGHPTINNHYDIALWTDANIVWQKSITEFVKKYYKKNTISIFKHSSRNNVNDEAIACLRLNKDTKESIVETLKYLRNKKYPDLNGLYESTVFIKNLKNPLVQETMQIWYDIILKHSPRDQLSFPYAIWKTNLKIDSINLDVWNNNWFYAVKHTSQKPSSDFHIYYGNPEKNFDFKKYYTYHFNQSNDTYSFASIIPNNTKEINISLNHRIGTIIDDTRISPDPQIINYFGTIVINNKVIICTSLSTIRIIGNFKKNNKIIVSIKLSPTNKTILDKTIETLWINNNSSLSSIKQLISENKILLSDNQKLLSDNQIIQDNYNNIINSKSWRLIEKTRKIFHH